MRRSTYERLKRRLLGKGHRPAIEAITVLRIHREHKKPRRRRGLSLHRCPSIFVGHQDCKYSVRPGRISRVGRTILSLLVIAANLEEQFLAINLENSVIVLSKGIILFGELVEILSLSDGLGDERRSSATDTLCPQSRAPG